MQFHDLPLPAPKSGPVMRWLQNAAHIRTQPLQLRTKTCIRPHRHRRKQKRFFAWGDSLGAILAYEFARLWQRDPEAGKAKGTVERNQPSLDEKGRRGDEGSGERVTQSNLPFVKDGGIGCDRDQRQLAIHHISSKQNPSNLPDIDRARPTMTNS